MISDPHDPRSFRRYLVFNADGSVASTHEVDASVPTPILGAIDVTDLSPTDFSTLTIDPAVAAAIQASIADVQKASANVDTAVQTLANAQTALSLSQGSARAAVSTASAKMSAAKPV